GRDREGAFVARPRNPAAQARRDARHERRAARGDINVTPEEMDRGLARDAQGVRASPRFAAGVMAAVRREAKVPPPIPFPWTRAGPRIGRGPLVVRVAVRA